MKSRSETKKSYMILSGIILTIVATGLFYCCWKVMIGLNQTILTELKRPQVLFIFICYAFLYFFISKSFHGFEMGYERKSAIAASQIISLIATDILIFLIIFEITGNFSILTSLFFPFFVLLMVQVFAAVLIGVVMTNYYWKKYPPINMIEIYGDHKNDTSVRINSLEHKYKIISSVHYSNEKIEQLITNYEAVLINDIPSSKKNGLLKFCFEQNIKVYFIPKISDILVKTSEELNVIDSPLYMCKNQDASIIAKGVKRGFDIIISLIALIVLSPLLLITAVSIKINDGGPVFFRQERCTIGGKKFMIIKFRSMIPSAENDGKAHPAEEDDERITKVGRIIRATRIDELPQFFNILKGEMSVVGPRPERVEHIEKYTQEIPEFSLRNKVKGGLTGYAQVYGKYNTTALDKLKLDLEYIMKRNLLLDFEIMIETLKVIFQKESTEGFSKEQIMEINQSNHTSF